MTTAAFPIEADGVDTVIGTVVNPAGLTHAKTVPIRRINAFADPGLGASPVTWHGFAIDRAGIAFTEAISVVGDQRIRIDLRGAAHDRRRPGLGARVVLRPGRQPGPGVCARHAGARRVPAGSRPASAPWSATRSSSCSSTPTATGCRATCGRSTGWPVCSSTRVSSGTSSPRRPPPGSGIEQFHPEYGINQFEISLAPDVAGGRRRPAGPGPDHHRPGGPSTTACGSACRRCRSPAAWDPVPTSTSRCCDGELAGVLRRHRRAGHDPGGRAARSAGSSPG